MGRDENSLEDHFGALADAQKMRWFHQLCLVSLVEELINFALETTSGKRLISQTQWVQQQISTCRTTAHARAAAALLAQSREEAQPELGGSGQNISLSSSNLFFLTEVPWPLPIPRLAHVSDLISEGCLRKTPSGRGWLLLEQFFWPTACSPSSQISFGKTVHWDQKT